MKWLAWAALALAAWTILNGIAHNVGVWNVARADGRAYDLRYASLLALGWSLVGAGALQAWGAREMWRDTRRGAWLAGAAAAFVIVLVLIYAPIFPAWGLLAMHVALLVWITISWVRSRSR